MNESTFEEVRGTLSTLPISIGALAEAYNRQFGSGSQAEKEFNLYPKNESVQTVYSLAWLEITAAADHMFALEKALTNPVMTFAPWSLEREVLESTSLANWLLEIDLSPEDRISRGMTIRLKHLEDQRRFARAAKHSEAVGLIEKRICALKVQAKSIGIEEKLDRNNHLIGFGGVLPSATDLADRAFSEGSTYQLLSAVAHGRTWARLALGLRRVNGAQAVEQHISEEAVLYLITNAIEWFTRPTWNFFTLYGWDLEKLGSTLESQYSKAHFNQERRFWKSES